MHSISLVLAAAAAVSASTVPPPQPVVLTATKSGVLPFLPAGFTGVPTLEGAIITKAPVNASNTGVLGPAQEQTGQSAAVYTATLPAIPFNELTGSTIRGVVTARTTAGQTGVTFTLSLTGLPNIAAYGPFGFHVHDQPVPADGNCTSTLGHLDTTNVGEYYTCDTKNPQNCQTGDLAGKHGKITNGTGANITFTDNYLSTTPGNGYSIVGKSFVIHTSNTTRLTCANFVAGNATGTTTTSPSAASTSKPAASYTGAAGKVVAGGAAVVLAAGVAALF